MLTSAPAYPAITARIISAVRSNRLNDGTPVVNFTVAVDTGAVGSYGTIDGVEQYVLRPTSDIFDIAVWDQTQLEIAEGLLQNQLVTFSPKSIKGGKPYQDKNGENRFTAKMTVTDLVPGAIGRSRADGAPATDGAQSSPEPEFAGIPF